MRASGSRRHAVLPPPFLAGALLLFLVATSSPVHAAVQPWFPPEADSLVIWAAQAKAGFQANQGDTATGANFEAYDRIGRIGRKMIRSMGKANIRQVGVVESVLDSLGFDTDVITDPYRTDFVLLMVR